jgi:putative transposase
VKYVFIRAHQGEFRVRAMCRVLQVHFSGFYAWLKEPLSRRAQDDARQTALIRQAWSDSGKVYGYRKLADDLRDQGEQVSENRVARLATLAGILAQVGYKHRPGRYGGKPAVVASNTLDRQFEVDAPDKAWGELLKAPLVRAQWRATSPTSRPTRVGYICLWLSTVVGKTVPRTVF